MLPVSLLVALVPLAVPRAITQPTAATIVAAGDIVPHADVLRSMRAHGAASVFGAVAGVLSRADLALANLETPADPSRPSNGDNTLRFNAPAGLLEAARASGIDVVSLANNHGYDQGPEGIAATLTAARARGLRVVGATEGAADPLEPARSELLGSTVCVIGATRILNFEVPRPREGAPRLALALPDDTQQERALVERVRAESRRCGAVLVSVHSGVEYTDLPEDRDRVFYRRIISAGATAVLGHHPHTPHPVERWDVAGRRGVIFYSLGNLVSAQGSAAVRAPLGPDDRFQVERDPRTREGLLAVLRLERDPDRPGALRLERAGWLPLWTENDRERARAEGVEPTVAASAMPWGGGGSALLRARWAGLVRRVGATLLYDRALLPGADTAWADLGQGPVAAR